MNSIRKKAGYLEGLLSAMKPDANDTAAQFNAGIVSLLSEMADRIEAMDDLISELNDYVESIDDDLTELEGMHDEDEDKDDFFDIGAIHEEPFRLIENEGAPAPEQMHIPVRCPECAAVFLAEGTFGRYICPVCEKNVKPQRLSKKNTPIAIKAED